jgi:tetratricopeptide (TPR) repeat protein/WD40 repeat protein
LEENNEAGGAPASESTLKLRTLDQPTIDGFAHNIHFSPDGQRLLVAAQVDNKAEIHVLDLLTGERWGTEVLHRYGTIDAQFSSDGQRLLTYGEDGVARIWNLIPSEPSWRPLLGLNDQGISCLAISPSGRFLAIGQGHHDMSVERGGGEAYGYLQAWDWATRRAVGPQIKFDSRVVQITFGHDERYATVRLSYDTAAVVDLVTGKILLQVGNPGKEAILSAVLRRDGRRAVISAPRDPQWPWNISTNPTRLYTQPVPAIPQTNLIAGKVNVVWSGPEFSRQHALLGPDGIWYLFVRDDGSAIVGRTLGAGGQIRLDRLYGKLTAAAYSHDGQKLVTVSDEGIAVIWDLEVGQPAAPLIRGAKSAKFSHDGRFLLTMGGEPYGAQVWDVATGEPLSLPIRTQSLPLAPSRQAEPELGPGGNFLISTAGDQLALWDFRPLQLPPQEVTLWAQAIAGHRIDEFGGDVPLDAREVAAAWKSYTQGHGLAERAPSKETIQQWHVRRAKEHEVVAQQYAYPWNAQQHGMESGFHFAARWHLTALLESDPNNAAYHYRRGNAQVALGHYAAAVADFSNALSLGYTKWEALFGRAVAHHELGRAEEASADMAAAIEQGCDESDYNLDEWQVRAAIAGLTRHLQRMPGDDGLLQRRAKLHWGLDHWAEALADYDALIAQDKEGTWHHWYLYRRGDCYAGLKQWDKAVADYTQALKKRTDDPDILQRRAMAYFELGHFEKAADDLAKVRGRLSSPQDVIYHEALLRLLLGDPEGQYGLLCAQVSLDTSKAYSEPQELAQSAWIWLVGKSAPASYEPIVTRLRGLMSGAGSTSQQVATRPEIPGNSGTPSESAPISVSNAYQFFLARALGTALYRDGNPTEAMGYFAASHRFSPQDPSVQYLLAMAHQDLGQAEEAASWLDMANSHFNSAYERLSFADRLLNSVLRRQATEGLQPSPE